MESVRACLFAGMLVLSAVLETSCATSAPERTPRTAAERGLVIPFELDEHHHVIITFLTDEHIPVRFNFDSGCPDKKAIVTERGFRNLTGSDYAHAKEERERYFTAHFRELTGRNMETCSQEEIELLEKVHSKKITTDFTPGALSCNDGGTLFTNQSVPSTKTADVRPLIEFSYCPAETEGYGDDGTDATIGFSFFKDAKRITFNYKKCLIEIDGEPLEKSPGGTNASTVPLHYFAATGHYFTPVVIDGKPDYALLDTGSEAFTLREPAFDRQTVMRLMENPGTTFFTYLNEIRKSREGKQSGMEAGLNSTIGEYNAAKTFTLGNITWEDVRALKITDIHMHTGEISRLIIASSNNIGYPFFKDKIIQFNLEDMTFTIRE